MHTSVTLNNGVTLLGQLHPTYQDTFVFANVPYAGFFSFVKMHEIINSFIHQLAQLDRFRPSKPLFTTDQKPSLIWNASSPMETR